MRAFQKMKAYMEQQDREQTQVEAQPAHNSPGPKETYTKYTKPPDPANEHSTQDNFVDIVNESRWSKESKTLGSIKPGTIIQYRIPRIVSPVNYEWEWHRGTIELVDEAWQMVLVISETEEQPWRWVARCYIQKETS